ncbi:MAG: aspartyl/glutamyl-tRNA amidotransferase subunit A [Actinobacteria bacterium]|nr:aspartyl/glutamyl-tRNA amidotransferase subunit A [Actinomycetota bacterium]
MSVTSEADLVRQDAATLSSALSAGDITSVEVTQACLNRISAVDGTIHAFLHVDADAALATAQDVDRRRAAGEELGRLAGVPLALKDVLTMRGVPTTCGSRILEGWRPPYDSTIVERLRAADVVILGKTNMDEFAMGSSTEHSGYGPTRNPWDVERIPGGSGGGSAAALAAFEAPLAIGTDTGGSIRQPASVTLSGEGYQPGVRESFDEAVAMLTDLGAEVVEVSCPHFDYALGAYYLILPSEASSNLARFDGMRYGLRAGDNGEASVEEVMSRTREVGFGAEVKRRIMLGTYALSSGYYDAYYGQAQKVRTLISRDFAAAFETVDVLVSPTTPTTAFKIGEKVDDPLAMYLNDIATIPVNLAGNCAMSVPIGLAREDDLPVGLQIMAPAQTDDRLYRVGAALEQALLDKRGHALIEEVPAL